MFDIKIFDGMSEKEKYDNMLNMLEGLISDEKEEVTNLANASALIMALVDRLNWCGFYMLKEDELVLGPFQGMPACNRIKIGKGVCGLAALKRQTVRVDDVHCFEDHIACDAASNSELVIPIIKDGILLGVLDLDSADKGRFTDLEQDYLEKCVQILSKYL